MLTDFTKYCKAHNLHVLSRQQLDEAYNDPDEWEGVKQAAFLSPDDVVHGAPVVVLKDDDTIEVVTAWADGRRHMADVWTPIAPNKLHTRQWHVQ
jgi:hypothetical protein